MFSIMSFYDDGLRFSCIYCGDCCRISDGYVWLTHDSERAICERLDIDDEEFRSLYTEIVDKMVALKSFPNGDCIFYDEKDGCKIYDVRPLQCKTFPFWPDNVRSSQHWQRAGKICPGIDNGKLHNKDEISNAAIYTFLLGFARAFFKYSFRHIQRLLHIDFLFYLNRCN